MDVSLFLILNINNTHHYVVIDLSLTIIKREFKMKVA